MIKKLTITLDQHVYAGLHHVVGQRKISHFIEDLVRPHVIKKDLASVYREMAQDEKRENDAAEWSETTTGDALHAPW